MEDPIEDIPQPDTPDFSRTKVLPDMLNCSNFEYTALSGLKVDNKKKDTKTRKIVFKLGQTNITKGVDLYFIVLLVSRLISNIKNLKTANVSTVN